MVVVRRRDDEVRARHLVVLVDDLHLDVVDYRARDLRVIAPAASNRNRARLARAVEVDDLGIEVLLSILVGTSLLGAWITWQFRIETAGVNLEEIGR